MSEQSATSRFTRRGRARPNAGGGEERQANDTADAILNSDRDVTVTPIRHGKGQLDDAAAPIPPPPEPNDSDYDKDPTSKTDPASEHSD